MVPWNAIVSFLHTDDLASKANIVIDPAELQAVTMDDLDEDEESAVSTSQVSLAMLHEMEQGCTCMESFDSEGIRLDLDLLNLGILF